VLFAPSLLVVILVQPCRNREQPLCNPIHDVPASTSISCRARLHWRLDTQSYFSLLLRTTMQSLDSHAPHGAAEVVPQLPVLLKRLEKHHVRLLAVQARDDHSSRHAL
jgi:hypothetical protein